jgi:pimeloyl-ACP methyl ester carboxylesterase
MGDRLRIGLYGISRGGSAAICAAAGCPQVRAVATDGAFPTSGTQVHYIYRWARIYSPVHWLFVHFPRWYVRAMAWMTCRQVGRRRGCRFCSVERAMVRLRNRPLLMIHGQRDNYIVPEIVQELLRFTRSRARLWIVPKAKHNQCLETAPEEYTTRVVDFFCRHLGSSDAEEQQEAA